MNIPSTAHRRLRLVPYVATLVATALSLSPTASATDYYWDADGDASAALGGTGTWDNTALLWRLAGPAGALTAFPGYGDPNNDAFLQGTAGTLTLGTNIFVNDLNVAPTSGTAYVITGTPTLTLNGAVRSTVDVASGTSLTITSGLAGTNGFAKSSAGTLVLDSAAGTSNLTGAISLAGGTLQVGSSTLADPASSQALRSNAVNIANGATLTTASQATGTGSTADLRVGQLSGSGSVTPGQAGTATLSGGAVNILALGDATFSGVVTTNGGLNLRGGNGTTQTFNGNLTNLTGTIGINSGATIALSGTGDSTSGVLGSVALAIRGGGLTLDNSTGNTSAAPGRISDSAAVSFVGGTLSLVGNAAGTSETVGAPTFNSGNNVISVTNNGGTGAQLTLTKTGSLRDSSQMTINFVGNGTGTLGAAGNNPRITFTGTPITVTSGTAAPLGLFANTATGATVGFATVNGTEWAGYGANGVIVVAPNAMPTTAADLNTLTATSNALFSPTATVTATGSVTPGAFKILPNGGTTLAMGTNTLTTAALMYAGATDFSITGTGTFAGPATRYIYVTDAGATLSMSNNIGANANPLTKAGAGYLNLNGAASQLTFTSAQNVNLTAGVLRGTTTSLGGGTSAGGVFSNLNFRGGVLEISGGGTFSRALLTTNATASGGAINFDNGGSARGDGGFSAINGDATVTLVTAIGGTTASTLVWNDGVFLSNGYVLTMGSAKSDSVLTLTNNVGLDSGAATSSYFGREIRVAAGTGNSASRLSGVLSGSANADLLKTGAGVLQLTGINTYAGNTLVQQGTLQVGTTGGSTGAGNGQLANTGKIVVSTGGTLLLGGTNASTDRLNNAAPIVLAGGTFNTGGLSEGTVTGGTPTAGVGALTLAASSTLDLGSGASIVAFANSSAQSFAGTLSIYNWTGNANGGGTDEVFFGTDATGLTSTQLGQIMFYSDAGGTLLGTAQILANGEIVPTAVPEPATVFGGLLLVGAAGWSQRRRLFQILSLKRC